MKLDTGGTSGFKKNDQSDKEKRNNEGIAADSINFAEAPVWKL